MPEPNRLDPLQEKQNYVTEDGRFQPQFIVQWQLLINFVKRLAAAVAAITKLNDTTIAVTAPITGGGKLSGPPVAIGHADSGVVAGAYPSANVTVNAKGHVTAITSGGGSGGVSPFWASAPTPPLSANFTLLKDAGTTATIADLTRGIRVNVLGAGATDNNAFVYQATPGATWTMTALLVPNHIDRRFITWGLAVRDSGTGRIQSFSLGDLATPAATLQGGPSFRDQRWSAIDTNSANVETPRAVPYAGPVWFQLVLDATNLTVFLSHDGENFVQVYQVAKGAYVATINQAGFWFGINQTDTPQNITESMLCMSFSLV